MPAMRALDTHHEDSANREAANETADPFGLLHILVASLHFGAQVPIVLLQMVTDSGRLGEETPHVQELAIRMQAAVMERERRSIEAT
mmetsp:Transcript_9603/g.35965  ORF Transcript_9603/g.35965 Transcript_9603/m.35965 type:complete len:87 (+) Transcript_9603:178-438(+)